MANREHLDILRQGVEIWNQWRVQHHLIYPDLFRADLKGVDLRGCNLSHALLDSADLSDAVLDNANLSRANLHWTCFTRSDLPGADLRKTNLVYAHLNEARLGMADFQDSNLWGADFTRAFLAEAHFDFASMNEAILNNTVLTNASFWRTRLDRASLANADLTGAYLRETDLSKAYLAGANFSKVILQHTILGNVDLSEVEGLESVWHAGRSFVDIHTILSSKGKIPVSFLHGIGVPEEAMEYVQQLGKAIVKSYFSCFIVYRRCEEEFTERLYADLQKNGVRCWLACPDHIDDEMMLYHESQPNREIKKKMMEPYDKMLLIISEETVLKGPSIGRDVVEVMSLEDQWKTLVCVPLLLGSATMQDIQKLDRLKMLWHEVGFIKEVDQLPEHPAIDFSSWRENDAYQLAFTNLLQLLKREV